MPQRQERHWMGKRHSSPSWGEQRGRRHAQRYIIAPRIEGLAAPRQTGASLSASRQRATFRPTETRAQTHHGIDHCSFCLLRCRLRPSAQ
eukprot:6317717-Pyramimonas_sp.AAC.1